MQEQYTLKVAGAHTSIGGTGPTLVLQNTNSTANNIVKLSFESASAGETVSINAINTNHTSHYGDMAFNTRGSAGYSEKMRIMANGNVGIGHTVPKSKLSIVSDGSVNTYSGVIGIENTASDKWASITLTDDIDTANASSNYYLIGRGSTYAQRYMSFHVPTAANYGSGSQPKFVFASTGGDILCSVEASTGDAYHKGNVGIGTVAPGASRLKVYNSTVTGNTQLHIHNDKAGDAAVLKLEGKRTSTNDTAQLLFANNGNVVARIDAVSAGDDGELRFFTSVSGTGSTTLERMSISAAGDLIKQGGVIKGERGTATAPPYTFSDDTDTGMFNISNAALGFSAGGVERMRLDGTYGHVTLGAASSLSSVDSASKGGKIAGMRSVNVLDWMQRRELTSRQHGDTAGCTNLYGVAFNNNGSSDNNKWYLGEGPSGALEWLWQGKSVTGTGAIGGWDGNSFSVDNNYSYMIINWVKRVSSVNTGTYYHGTSSVVDSSGNSLGNPYMTICSTGTLPLNVWCVDIQPLHAWHMTSNTAMGQQGLFRTDTGARLQVQSGQFGSGVSAYRLGSSSNQSHNINHRSYLYYAGEGDGTELHWASPMIYRVDGTQPRVSELIKGFGAAAVI